MNTSVLCFSSVTARIGFQKGILGRGPLAASADRRTPVKDANARTYSLPSLSNSAVFTAGRLGSFSALCRPRGVSRAGDRAHDGARVVTGKFPPRRSGISRRAHLPRPRGLFFHRGPYACQQSVRDISKSFHATSEATPAMTNDHHRSHPRCWIFHPRTRVNAGHPK